MRLCLLACAVLIAAIPCRADEPLPVVASFSILGDMTARIGGDRIAVTTLVDPDGDAHVFEPGPRDLRAVAGARVLVVNGLGFEGWMARLEQASGFAGVAVVASTGVRPLSPSFGQDDQAGADPHAWQDVANAETYVRNIADGLERADPAGASVYRANAAAYVDELRALDAEIRATLGRIPESARVLVTSHDAFRYFASAYGVRVLPTQGLGTESEPSAADIARVITSIRAAGVRALFLENITDSRLLEQIASETGAVLGGTLFSDSLSPKGGPADSYIAMMRHNASAIAAALQE